MVELICNLDPYYCITEKRYFSIDMLMMMRFKYIDPRGRINPRIYDVFNFKIIHKDNNSDNYNLSNLYCKLYMEGTSIFDAFIIINPYMGFIFSYFHTLLILI